MLATALEPTFEVRLHRGPVLICDRVVRRVANPDVDQHVLAKIPSKVAGSASRARRDSTFLASVLNSTRIAPQRSNACSSISSFASTFAPLDHARRASQVLPISTP